MPIYTSHRAVFVHIPKTGGSTVTTVLKRDTFLGPKRNLSDPRGDACETIFEIRDLLGAEFDEFFSFSFVRNPWDRFVSAYHYVMERRPELEQVTVHKRFEDFVRAFEADPDTFKAIRYFRPQNAYLLDENGNIPVDFVGRFERFEQDLGTVLDRLGVHRSLIRHRKKSRRSDYRDYFDARSQEIVADAYRADIEAFDYSYGDGCVRGGVFFLKRVGM